MRMRHTVLATAAALALTIPATAAYAADGVGKSGTQLGPDEIGRSANVEHLINLPSSGPLAGATGTDIAFQDDMAFVGNYNGFVIYDVKKPEKPRMVAQVSCPGSQNDVTVSGNLLYLSTDSSRSDDSCTSVPQSATIKESWEGIKIFDISDVRNPRYIKSVETACGSHTHSLIPGKKTDYLYVSSYSPSETFPDCKPPHDSISIIAVPKKAPTKAAVVAEPNLFPDGGYTNTSGCHDITVNPARGIAAGACMGDGIIMDITNPVAPKVIDRVRDTTNFAFWHSATFNNDATKVVFTDELGGGGAATCNAAIGPNRGANGIYDLGKDRTLTFRSYYKIPRHQFDSENCVAHNGSLIPVKGRDVMVQSWYMGGTSFWDFTDSSNPREIGYFERGPAGPAGGGGGTWSSYYYNGHVYSSDLGKGFDVLRITDKSLGKAAKVRMDQLNVQTQPIYKVK
ncbi:LVIVD repeat-containing protein [Phycicoccus sp. Root101]|uniref:LVIVD repeat-containing protein n=1 Tax=Phycicoccus sp. Root101 TaxID=1736421 RepID=UPI000703BBFB|nr:hypothetical protein [Phycicoccus sp. Root101]KQU65486.1 hypothetical protein ASC58_18665 [Phycicoccus sp. Root101]